jgi:predicted dehydrogenase
VPRPRTHNVDLTEEAVMAYNRRQFLKVAAAAPLAAAMSHRGARAGAQEGKMYRACIIGDTNQGGYGHNLHLMWGMRDDIEVVALADPDNYGREKHAEEAEAERTYADYREMLEKEKPDLVAIGPRWTIHHKEYLLACAEAGAHGIIEKPLCTDLAEADEAIRALDAKNLKWSIAFNFRASPIIEAVKQLVFDEGYLGEVVELRGRGKEDHRAGGEDLIVLGTHLFDMMQYFAGKPQWCAADIRHEGRPATKADIREATEPLGPIVGDTIQAMYGFPNNLTAYFASVKAPSGNTDRWGLDIYGTGGIMTIRYTAKPTVHVLRDPTWTPGATGAAWELPPDMPEVALRGPVDHYRPIIDDLIAAIEEDREPEVSIKHGRDAQAMVQAVWEAPLHGGRVAMPLERRDHPLGRW